MGDFTQPQQKYAGTGENCNIVIVIIFYPIIQTFLIFLCLLFGFVSTQILNMGTHEDVLDISNFVVVSCFSRYFEHI